MADTRDNRYGSILYAAIYKVREIGERDPGSDQAFVCYQILDTILQEAEVWDIPPADLGLADFDPASLLKNKKQTA